MNQNKTGTALGPSQFLFDLFFKHGAASTAGDFQRPADPGDPELLAQWHKAKDLVRDYGLLDSQDLEGKDRILSALLGGRGRTALSASARPAWPRSASETTCGSAAGPSSCRGVTIGDNVVIGAGSVVTKDIPSDTIALGNPCRVVRENRPGEADKEELP